MGLFDQFPYTNFHELNLMWILEALKEIQTTTEQFVAINSLKYADPIQWNITSQYEKNTIVIDPQTGTAYISVQPVPAGVALTNTDYWTVVFNLREFVIRAAKNFTTRFEEQTTPTATFNSAAGDWLVWGDTLYVANVNITAGDSYVVGGNITHFTMEDIIGHLKDLTTTDKSNIVAAINEVIHTMTTADAALSQAITDEATARDNADTALSQAITNAETTLSQAITNEATARGNADTALSQAITDEATARGNADTDLRNYINDKIDNMSKYKDTYINVKTLGAVGDGTLHLISEFYDTLADAQAVYPFITSLSVSIDYAVIQKALNEYTTVYIPQGTYIIDKTVTIPQTRFQVVNGDGSRLTFLKGVGNDLVMFNYERDTAAAGKTLTFNDVAIITDSNNVTGIKYHGVIVNNSRYEDNYLNIMRCYLNGPEYCFDLYAAGNCHFDYIDAAHCGRIILLRRAASFIHGSKIFAMSCKSLLYADDNLHDGVSNGIELQECEAIFSTDSSFRVNGWQGVYLYRCSADLCASAVDQVFLYNCADCAITDSWIAGQDATSSIGLRIWASKDVSVKGCTIQNVDFGCRIDGLPGYDTATVIDACVFEGCNRNDVLLSGVFGVTLINNTFLDAIPLTGTDAPVYANVAEDCIITLNRFKSAAYTVTLGTNSIAASNIFNITNP